MWASDLSVLIQQANLPSISDDLVSSGEWSICQNPYVREGTLFNPDKNTTAIREIWLVSQKENLPGAIGSNYLRLWPEELYQLSVAGCKKYEVPDLILKQPFVLEEEFCRDTNHQFGPRKFSLLDHERSLLHSNSYRCKWIKRNIPLYVPTIEDHLDALLEQAYNERRERNMCGNNPTIKIHQYIEHHMWDWPPVGEWLLSERVSMLHREQMTLLLDGYRREPVRQWDAASQEWRIRINPWDPSLPADRNVARMPASRYTDQELSDTLSTWLAKYNRIRGPGDPIGLYER
jgi:hypothetical protein